MKYHLETYGCQMNENDSHLIGLMLDEAGYAKAEGLSDADIVVVNTCCVRQSAENRIKGFIGHLSHHKKLRPHAILVVCGCLPQKPGAAQEMAKKARHLDIIIGTFALSRLPQYIEEIKNGAKGIIDVEERYDNEALTLSQGGNKPAASFKAQVSIIYGCDNFCSYCIVPHVRGRERSRQPELILQEIQGLAANGCKEVQLLGQNVNSYGKDLTENWNFARLLQEICAIDGLSRIRYMTSHPRDFSSELLDTIAAHDKICKHFHLPVQSGCNKILKMMNRGYTAEEYLRLVEKIRSACPDAAITSDLIIGFPGENQEDFEETLAFLKTCRLDAAYTFLYSRRSGTPAAEMPGQVEEREKRRRLSALMEIQNPISLALNQRFIGCTLPVLVEGESKNNADYFSGRLEQNKIVVFPKGNAQPGDFVHVQLLEAQTWNLKGEIKE